MFKYFIKRLIFIVPALFILSVNLFLIGNTIPGSYISSLDEKEEGPFQSDGNLKNKEIIYKRLKLDFPLFYFSPATLADPDTLYKIRDKRFSLLAGKLLYKYGNWKDISTFLIQLKEFEQETEIWKNNLHANSYSSIHFLINRIYFEDNLTALHFPIADLPLSLKISCADLESKFKLIRLNATPYKIYIPALNFYGTINQYHHWISDLLQGNAGISYRSNRKVSLVLLDSLKNTFLISFLSLVLSYFIAIPLGVTLAGNYRSKYFSAINTFLFLLSAAPVFLLAMLLLFFFANNSILNLFPSFGISTFGTGSLFSSAIPDLLIHITLPVVCLTLSSLPYLTFLTKDSIKEVLSMEFIKTAEAKGLKKKDILWNHALKNASFPLITSFSDFLPMLVTGSLIVEIIFSIPGIGKLMSDSIAARDYPIVFMIVMLVGVIKIMSNMLADLCYLLTDPRVTFD